MSEEIAQKKWWERPEKWGNLIGLGIIGLVGFATLDTILPLVRRVLQLAFESTLYAIGTGSLLALVTWIITSKDLHKLAWHGYEMVMRRLTRIVIEIDPIAVMHNYKKSLKINAEILKKSLGELLGQQRELEAKVQQMTKEFQSNMRMAKQAKEKIDAEGMRGALRMYSRKAGRRQESTVTYQGLLNRLKKHIALSKKIQEVSNLMIEDIADTIDVETEKRKTIQASHKAMSASRRILEANEQREMYDMALESVTQDYFLKLGEIEQFMSDSQHFVTTMDLQNGVFEEDALAKLEEWDKRSEGLLSGGTGTTKFRVEPDQFEGDLSHDAVPDDFSELFKSLDA